MHATEESNDVKTQCAHCGQMASAFITSHDLNFCCRGCAGVYKILNEQGLLSYYEHKECSLPVISNKSDYSFVDRPAFSDKYAYGANGEWIKIFVGGVHCAACVWLLEKLDQYVPGVESARLNLGSQILTIKRDPKQSLKPLFERISKWGYLPQATVSSSTEENALNSEYKMDLYRLGVAALGSGNIMLLSAALYLGIDQGFKLYFELISLALTIPVLVFSGWPFFKNSWYSLKESRVSIDLPISIAVLTAFAVSLYGIYNGTGTFFDSITFLVFMITATRFWFKRVHYKHVGQRGLSIDFDLNYVKKLDGQKTSLILPHEVNVGDRIHIEAGDLIPVDSRVALGTGFVNLSLINGESNPVEVRYGDQVWMGSTLVSGQLELVAMKDLSSSRIPRLLGEIEDRSEKSQSLLLTEKVGQWFLITVLVGVLGVLLWHLQNDPREGFYRALALIIVACPCTFASVVPFVLSLSMRRLREFGVFVRSISVFERLPGIKNIYFDKTGTLTYGTFNVIQWDWQIGDNPNLIKKILQGITKSDHPVSKAISRYLLEKYRMVFSEEVATIVDLPARGFEARFKNGDVISIQKTTDEGTSINQIPNSVALFYNNHLIAKVLLGDTLKPEAFSIIPELKKSYRLTILSGDQRRAVSSVADSLGIKHFYSDLTLDEKADLLRRSKKSIMVGDGNNDALAIGAATIGVAVSGGVETALKCSDVYLSTGSLETLSKFLEIGRRTNRLVYQVLVISVAYNGIAGAMAVFGIIHPLIAALIMPLNAVTALGFSTWTLRRSAWK